MHDWLVFLCALLAVAAATCDGATRLEYGRITEVAININTPTFLCMDVQSGELVSLDIGNIPVTGHVSISVAMVPYPRAWNASWQDRDSFELQTSAETHTGIQTFYFGLDLTRNLEGNVSVLGVSSKFVSPNVNFTTDVARGSLTNYQVPYCNTGDFKIEVVSASGTGMKIGAGSSGHPAPTEDMTAGHTLTIHRTSPGPVFFTVQNGVDSAHFVLKFPSLVNTAAPRDTATQVELIRHCSLHYYTDILHGPDAPPTALVTASIYQGLVNSFPVRVFFSYDETNKFPSIDGYDEMFVIMPGDSRTPLPLHNLNEQRMYISIEAMEASIMTPLKMRFMISQQITTVTPNQGFAAAVGLTERTYFATTIEPRNGLVTDRLAINVNHGSVHTPTEIAVRASTSLDDPLPNDDSEYKGDGKVIIGLTQTSAERVPVFVSLKATAQGDGYSPVMIAPLFNCPMFFQQKAFVENGQYMFFVVPLQVLVDYPSTAVIISFTYQNAASKGVDLYASTLDPLPTSDPANFMWHLESSKNRMLRIPANRLENQQWLYFSVYGATDTDFTVTVDVESITNIEHNKVIRSRVESGLVNSYRYEVTDSQNLPFLLKLESVSLELFLTIRAGNNRWNHSASMRAILIDDEDPGFITSIGSSYFIDVESPAPNSLNAVRSYSYTLIVDEIEALNDGQYHEKYVDGEAMDIYYFDATDVDFRYYVELTPKQPFYSTCEPISMSICIGDAKTICPYGIDHANECEKPYWVEVPPSPGTAFVSIFPEGTATSYTVRLLKTRAVPFNTRQNKILATNELGYYTVPPGASRLSVELEANMGVLAAYSISACQYDPHPSSTGAFKVCVEWPDQRGRIICKVDGLQSNRSTHISVRPITFGTDLHMVIHGPGIGKDHHTGAAVFWTLVVIAAIIGVVYLFYTGKSKNIWAWMKDTGGNIAGRFRRSDGYSTIPTTTASRISPDAGGFDSNL